MATKRSYGDRCGVARALDVVGERWALLVVRELLLGPKRFTDLRAGICHAGPNVLAQRLRELEAAGVVRRRKLPPPAASRVYELTEWGRELEPVVTALGRWGARSPLRSPDADMSVDSHVLAIRTMFDPAAAGDLELRLELRLGEEVFHAVVSGGELDAGRGAVEAPEAVLATDPLTLASILWQGRDLDEARRAGDVTVEGDAAAVERFLGLFSLPQPAAAPVVA